MPAKSAAQLKLMRMALVHKRGKLKRVSNDVKRVAKTMTIKELKDFVDTQDVDELPEHIDEDFATLGGTPGMGDVSAPTSTSYGSGDSFSSFGLYTQNFLSKTKRDRKRKKNDPMKHYKPKKGRAAFQPIGTISYFHDFIHGLGKRDPEEFTNHNDDNQGSILGSASDAGNGGFDGGFDSGDGGGE